MSGVPQKVTADPEIAVDAAFGERVKAARKAKGWNQWALARAVTPQVSQATISQIERGVGSSSSVLAICKVLGIDPPSVGETPEMQRWIDVGRVLARRPDLLAYHLQMLETLAASLAPAPTTASPRADPSARH